MVSNGSRIFVLGGKLAAGAQADETPRIHVLETSTYLFLSFYLDNLQVRKQNTSRTRNPTPMLSSLVRRQPNLRCSHPRAPQPSSNHNTRCPWRPLHPMPTRHPVVLLVFKILPSKNWITGPPRRSLASKTQVRMVCYRNPRV